MPLSTMVSSALSSSSTSHETSMLRSTSTAKLVAHSRSPPSVRARSLGMRRSISLRLKVRGQSSTGTSLSLALSSTSVFLVPMRTTSSTISSTSSSIASRSSSSSMNRQPHSLARTAVSVFFPFFGALPGCDSTTNASDPVKFQPPSSCCRRMRRHRRAVVSHCLVAAMLPLSKPTMRPNSLCNCMKS